MEPEGSLPCSQEHSTGSYPVQLQKEKSKAILVKGRVGP
jgi:hypothetical protein